MAQNMENLFKNFGVNDVGSVGAALLIETFLVKTSVVLNNVTPSVEMAPFAFVILNEEAVVLSLQSTCADA